VEVNLQVEIRHRGAPKGGGCQPAARPHKIEIIIKKDFAEAMISKV
jgi:hypothetical protein